MPKFPKPEPYDGVKGDVRSFLTQAKAYLRVNQTITGAAGQIMCIGNLLTGKAFEWWDPTLRDYLDNENDAERDEETNNTFRSYAAFENKLRNAFGNPDEEGTATRHLKNLRQTGSATHYNREFRQHVIKLDLGDSALMEYFYDGLRENVKDELSKIDKPEESDEYVNMAIKIDNRNYQRRMERGYKGPCTTYKSNTKHKRSTAYSGTTHSGPMELDAAQRDHKKVKGKCYNCGKEGHFANKCRQPKKNNWKPLSEKKIQEVRTIQELRRENLNEDNTAVWRPRRPEQIPQQPTITPWQALVEHASERHGRLA